MWPFNSPFSKYNIQSSFTLKSSFSDKIKDNNTKEIFNEISFQTPKKEINNNNNNNLTPFKLGINYYFENLYPSESESLNINPINNLFGSFNNDLTIDNDKEKKSTFKSSFTISPKSFYKSSSHYLLSSNNYSSELIKITNNNINTNELIHKNLSLLFNDIKDDNSLYNNSDNDNNNYLFKNMTYKFEDKDNILVNNNIKRSHYSSKKNKFSKKIFECSSSTSVLSLSSLSSHKRRRIRKNNEQLFLLKKFYSEHKYWNKNQIKEISSKIGIKENKVYKWLWDQRNKEIKNTKFIVNKNTEKKNL